MGMLEMKCVLHRGMGPRDADPLDGMPQTDLLVLLFNFCYLMHFNQAGYNITTILMCGGLSHNR